MVIYNMHVYKNVKNADASVSHQNWFMLHQYFYYLTVCLSCTSLEDRSCYSSDFLLVYIVIHYMNSIWQHYFFNLAATTFLYVCLNIGNKGLARFLRDKDCIIRNVLCFKTIGPLIASFWCGNCFTWFHKIDINMYIFPEAANISAISAIFL